MSIEMKKLIKRLRCDLFADRATLKEAFDYAQMITDGSSNPPAVLTAVYVVTNTLARIIEESERCTDAILNSTSKDETNLCLALLDQVQSQIDTFRDGLISTEQCSYVIKQLGGAMYDHFRREYVCFWGECYGPREPITVTSDFFNLERGYSIDDYTQIANLKLGEAVTFMVGGTHTVVRSK